MDSIKIDTLTNKKGAEAYFIRATEGNNEMFENTKKPTILVMHGGPYGKNYSIKLLNLLDLIKL